MRLSVSLQGGNRGLRARWAIPCPDASKDRMTDSSGAPGALRWDIWPQNLGSSLYNWQHFSPYDRTQACQPPRGRQHTRPDSCLSLLWSEVPFPGSTVDPDPASLSELTQMATLDVGHMHVHISKLNRTSQNTALGHATQRHLVRLLPWLFSFT